ncbi:hypothetical protein GTP58_08220 [Duganella sp. CY15W]|uniref:hypothetical protein n=1 Tax=Duganella sp. CY15W TaxID=2692172 RepID=UPI0013699EC7|nr:hypothetical protein [Duganella sp. CY15W]MYM28307.1 hypothetical protein [Duganella sp. CY15W]
MATEFRVHAFLKKWGATAKNAALGAMGLFSLGLGMQQSFADKLQVGGLLLTAGLLMVMASDLSRFKSIKGLGVEAQLQELGDKLTEADELLQHIKESVGLTADVTFQLLAHTGRPDASFSRGEALKIADAFRQQMKALGSSDKDIDKHMLPWHRVNLKEQLKAVHIQLSEYAQIQNQEATRETLFLAQENLPESPARQSYEARVRRNTRFVQRISRLWDGDEFVYVRDVGSLLAETDCGTPDELEALIQNIQPALNIARYYVEHLDFKSREGWISTENFYQRSFLS